MPPRADSRVREFLTGSRNRQVDVDSDVSLTAAMLMAVIGPAVFIVHPEWVKGLLLYAATAILIVPPVLARARLRPSCGPVA